MIIVVTVKSERVWTCRLLGSCWPYFRDSATSHEPASVSLLYGGRSGKAKGAAQFPQLLVPRDHFSAPEAVPAENLDPRALSARWCGNPLERFPGGGR